MQRMRVCGELDIGAGQKEAGPIVCNHSSHTEGPRVPVPRRAHCFLFLDMNSLWALLQLSSESAKCTQSERWLWSEHWLFPTVALRVLMQVLAVVACIPPGFRLHGSQDPIMH